MVTAPTSASQPPRSPRTLPGLVVPALPRWRSWQMEGLAKVRVTYFQLFFHYFSIVEANTVVTTETVEDKTTTAKPIADGVEHIDAEALPLVDSNTGELAGIVMGGVLAAVLVTALVWRDTFTVLFTVLCLRLFLCFTASCIPKS